jgi:hypothetical protein
MIHKFRLLACHSHFKELFRSVAAYVVYLTVQTIVDAKTTANVHMELKSGALELAVS